MTAGCQHSSPVKPKPLAGIPSLASVCAASRNIQKARGVVRKMHLSTEFASETDLVDLVMEKGIVVEVWDRVGLAAVDVSRMRVTVSVVQIFTQGEHEPFRAGHFLRTKP
jgi:hypothetical protein